VGSKTYDGVRFQVYPGDHLPPHVHGFYAELEVIVDLVDGVAKLSSRADPIDPPNGKRSDVTHVLKTAAKYADVLVELWRVARG
jgi:hypothetical protein